MIVRKYFRDGIFALVLLGIGSSCSPLFMPQGDGSGTTSYSLAEKRASDRYEEWCSSFPNYIIPRMCAYYQLHPERFKPTGQGEEITIDGFAAFVKNDDYFKSGTRCYVLNGTVFDPWRDPVHFVQDLNMDGFIEAKGERRNVLKVGTSGLNQEHHFGICKHSPFKGPYGHPWERIFSEIF